MELPDFFSYQVTIPLIVAALSAVYLYYRKKYSFWTSRGIPQSRTVPFFGVILENLLQPIQDVEIRNYKKCGRIYGSYEGMTPILTVGDPELVKQIMVKDFNTFINRREIVTGHPIADQLLTGLLGEQWRRVRGIVSPSFTSGKMRKMAHLVNDSAMTIVENFLKAAKTESTVDTKRYFGAFTMDTIASCAFGTKIKSQEDPDNPFVTYARKLFLQNPVSAVLTIVFPKLAKLLRLNLFPEDVMRFFTETSTRIIEERKKKGERGNDFLQLVMDARDGKVDKTVESGQELENHHDLGSQVLHVSNKALSTDEAIAQCVLFFLVGYDTTASTLTFASYLLALNPDCQDILIKEVDQVWEENNGKIDFDIVSKMEYLDAVICETLRMYSILIKAERTAEEDYVLGDTGITIPKGTLVGIPIYAMHYDPEWYPEPEKFDPTRFSPENKSTRNPYTFIPFGAGPRNCIGMRFALMEAKLCLVHVLRHVRFVRTAKTKVPLDFYSGQGLLQSKEVCLKIVKRNV